MKTLHLSFKKDSTVNWGSQLSGAYKSKKQYRLNQTGRCMVGYLQEGRAEDRSISGQKRVKCDSELRAEGICICGAWPPECQGLQIGSREAPSLQTLVVNGCEEALQQHRYQSLCIWLSDDIPDSSRSANSTAFLGGEIFGQAVIAI